MSLFAHTNHEIFLITSRYHDEASGFIATWLLPATLVPGTPRITAVFSPQNYTFDLIRKSRRFVAHLLADDQYDLVPQFGLESGRDQNKFKGLKVHQTAHGLPTLEGTCGWVECLLVDEMDSGDRIICLADVTEEHLEQRKKPLRKNDLLSLSSKTILEQLGEKRHRDGERDRLLMKNFPPHS